MELVAQDAKSRLTDYANGIGASIASAVGLPGALKGSMSRFANMPVYGIHPISYRCSDWKSGYPSVLMSEGASLFNTIAIGSN